MRLTLDCLQSVFGSLCSGDVQRVLAQQHVTTANVIYDTLVADTTFMALVGKRIFKAGNTELNAISIVTPGEDLPAIKSVTGLEVVIHDVTSLKRKQYITNDYDIDITWKVFLLAWPGANGATLSNAALRIMQRFSEATTLETNPTPSGLGSIAQLLVLVPSKSVVI
jgi:hypothetical protein